MAAPSAGGMAVAVPAVLVTATPLGRASAPRPGARAGGEGRAGGRDGPAAGAAAPGAASCPAPSPRGRPYGAPTTTRSSGRPKRPQAERVAGLTPALSERVPKIGGSRVEGAAAMSQQGQDFRVEHDSMGDVRVPVRAKWRAQTQRAVQNCPISGQPVERELIRGLALIKGFGARVRAEHGLLDEDRAEAIATAAAEVARGDWDAEFPIDVFQTGSGTSSNMNANEVIATLASQRLEGAAVHPNDDVNDPLSSNDQFPSAIHIAATSAVVNDLIPALRHLASSLEAKAGEFAEVVKS